MKKKEHWSRNDKLGAAVLIVAVVTLASAFFIPEVRRFFGLEKPTAAVPALTTVPQHRISSSPPSSSEGIPAEPNPEPLKVHTAQHTTTKVTGNANAAGNNVKGTGNVVDNNNQLNTAPSAPTVQVSAPNGIAIGGGIVNNPTVNNFGPPPPPMPTVTVCLSHPVIPEGAQHLTVITFKTDVEIMEPWYALFFDGPVSDGSAEMNAHSFGFTHGRADKLPNPENSFLFKNTSIDFGVPRWLPRNEIKLTIPSKAPVNLIKLLSGSGENGRDEKFVFGCDP